MSAADTATAAVAIDRIPARAVRLATQSAMDPKEMADESSPLLELRAAGSGVWTYWRGEQPIILRKAALKALSDS